jgi:plastocyanin
MRREDANSRRARGSARLRTIAVGAVTLAGLAVGATFGAGVSAGQYGPYGPYPPPTSTPPPSPAPTHKQAKNTVVIKGASTAKYRFSPKTLKIKHGKRVKWSWNSNAPHNITFRKLHRHSKTVQHGSYKRTFTKPGTYRYLCTIHGFTGKIVVK